MSKPDQTKTSDMAARKVFSVLTTAAGDGTTARLGKLALPGRRPIETPNYTGVTSRGVIPHVTQDHLSKYSSLGSAYMALEDFVEKKDAPPIYQTPKAEGEHDLLHRFNALPKEIATILALRRCPAVTPPSGNTSKKIPIFTSTGFGFTTIPQYAAAIERLQPDVVIGLADLLHTSQTPTSKRQLRMVERTDEWLDEFLKLLNPETRKAISVFAPLLPVEHPIQWEYLKHLSDDRMSEISGLAVYDINLLPELTSYNFSSLAKLSLDPPKTPHEVLHQVALGIDLVLAPFVNNISDAGVALTFKFPPQETVEIQPLGVDMWNPDHKVSLAPLLEGCKCYACQKHHRAFINHLLNAKEMLGWSLLQIHNHHVLSDFFGGIRQALSKGVSGFEKESKQFAAAYESELPAGTGERPRARGYHFKSEACQEPYNRPGWQDLEGGSTPANEETPLVPDVDGQTLEDKGFAQKQDQ